MVKPSTNQRSIPLYSHGLPGFLAWNHHFFLRFSWLRCWTLRCTRPTTPTTPTTWPRWPRSGRLQRKWRRHGTRAEVEMWHQVTWHPIEGLKTTIETWHNSHNMTTCLRDFEGLSLKNRKPCRHMNRTSRSCHELLQLMSTPVCTSIDFRTKSKRKLFLKNIQFWAVDDVDPSSYEGFRQFRKEKNLNSTRQKL